MLDLMTKSQVNLYSMLKSDRIVLRGLLKLNVCSTGLFPILHEKEKKNGKSVQNHNVGYNV